MKYITRIVATAIITLPFITSAATSAELTAQAQVLLAQVQALQAQLAAMGGGTTGGTTVPVYTGTTGVSSATPGVNSSACPLIGRVLNLGDSGDDVSRLQTFLSLERAVYPEALVTGYYGSLTESAVKRWQAKYNIVASGTAASTGYGVTGPRTAAAISLQCSTMTTGSTGTTVVPGSTTANPGVMGGFIQVTPISGRTPLNVKVTVTANTAGSCTGGVYSLEWGDGSSVPQIIVPPGNCGTVVQNYAHLYLYGGTYIIKLSAGTHSTSATVTVSGASAPTTPTQRETFNANPISGDAPLTVTFSGVVTGGDLGWCPSGCSSALDFGDGSTGSVSLPNASNGVSNYSLTHTYSTGGSYTAKLYQGAASAGHLVGSPITIDVTGNAGTYTYTPMAVTPNVGGNPLVVSVQFDLFSSCTGYDFSWGDSSAHITQADGGSACAATPVTKNFSHTYSGAGSYTILLKRGVNLERNDSASLTISNQ